jgi:hypothetical protein
MVCERYVVDAPEVEVLFGGVDNGIVKLLQD